MSQANAATVFQLVGGMPAFVRLVESFYGRVEHDDLLRPEYPENLESGKRHLARFLAQYWGGGPIYSAERGHPRLRMRHANFNIRPETAERWARHMAAAVHEQGWPPDAEAQMLDYIARATPTLINRPPAGASPILWEE